MIFETDRRTVTEGDVVELSWQCEGAESVTLTIDNGYRSTDIPLAVSGSKRFRLNRSKGRTHLTLAVSLMGKIYRKKISVRVKPLPTAHADIIDQRGRTVTPLRHWWQGARAKWSTFRSNLRHTLRSLPESKQMAVKMLVIIGVALLLCAVWPRLYSAVLLLVMAYLVVVLVRR